MSEEDIDQLHEWLAEAAIQLCATNPLASMLAQALALTPSKRCSPPAGRRYGDDENEHVDLVERTGAVMRNSQLTAAVFASFDANPNPDASAARSPEAGGAGESERASEPPPSFEWTPTWITRLDAAVASNGSRSAAPKAAEIQLAMRAHAGAPNVEQVAAKLRGMVEAGNGRTAKASQPAAASAAASDPAAASGTPALCSSGGAGEDSTAPSSPSRSAADPKLTDPAACGAARGAAGAASGWHDRSAGRPPPSTPPRHLPGSNAKRPRPKLNLSALPSSLRSLLDERSLHFLRELWAVLRRDEPDTAEALLHPTGNDSITTDSPGSGAAAPPAKPADLDLDVLSASRSDAMGEALYRCMAPASAAMGAPSHPVGEDGAAARAHGAYDLERARVWVEKRVLQAVGFADAVVVDAVMRWIESMQPSASADPAPCRSDTAALQSHLELLIEGGEGAALVRDLSKYLASPASRGGRGESPTAGHSAGGGGGGSSRRQKFSAAHTFDAVAGPSTAGTRPKKQPSAGGAAGVRARAETASASELPPEVEAWCAAGAGVPEVLLLTQVEEALLVIMRWPSGEGAAALLREGARGLSPIPSPPGMLMPLLGAWAAPQGALLWVGGRKVDEGGLAEGSPAGRVAGRLVLLGGSADFQLTEVAPLPPGHIASLDAAWTADFGIAIAAIVEPQRGPVGGGGGSSAPLSVCWPAPPQVRQLHRYLRPTGWQLVGSVGPTASRLNLAITGQRAAWRECTDQSQGGGGLAGWAEGLGGVLPAASTLVGGCGYTGGRCQ